MNRTFTIFLVLAMLLGIGAGLAAHSALAADQLRSLADALGLITTVFLRLIKMIIAPLVFSTLVVGIAHMEDAATIGRVGARSIAWFVLASLLSLGLGLLFVHLFQPGLGLALPAGTEGTAPAAAALNIKDFVEHLVPKSIVEAMANNEILQIVVFSCFVGTAIAATENRAPAILAVMEQVVTVMLKITGYVMYLAPLVVFAALTSTVATQGAGILVTYARFVGGFYFAMLVLWVLLLAVAALIRGRIGDLLKAVREPVLLAFSTASSEAAYPKLLENLQSIGLPKQVVSFVLPLGYSFNLDGSMMYCTFATLFIAQAYGIDLTWGQQITLLLLMMVTSKGMAGVPRASLVVIAAALPYFHLPEAGLLLVLAVDHLLDMGRSGTNIVGNSVACVVVDAWNGRKATAPA
ncbi:MAG: dicarboxylate/amino acid:cation symporter [Alphaproteobacteria bacterium]|nr:dicarboxylate/amino acid:cation symporter [Alphaproteobacteria bacterium]MBL7096670.1 dicarboxylate/amino acid:cation symporter [Alphaproteobacteria bacterium]